MWMFPYFKCTPAIKRFFSMLRGQKTVEENGKLFLNVLPETCHGDIFKGNFFVCLYVGIGPQFKIETLQGSLSFCIILWTLTNA